MTETLDIADFPRVTRSDGAALAALRTTLPAGWDVVVEGIKRAEWTAHVLHPAEPWAWPRFLVAPHLRCIGRDVRGMEGSSFTSTAFPDLKTVFDLIPSGIFAR